MMKSHFTNPLKLTVTLLWLTCPWCISEELPENRNSPDFSLNQNFQDVLFSKSARNLQKRSPLQIGAGSQRRRPGFDRKKSPYTKSSFTTQPSSSNSDYSFSSDYSGSTSGDSDGKNASDQSFTGNPNQYTIGGVLSSMDIEHLFIQVLSVSIFLLISKGRY